MGRASDQHGGRGQRVGVPMRRRLRSPHSPFRNPRGLTLIELLVVIFILSILTAAAIPLMNTAGGSRRTREAVRGVNSYFTSARAKAVGLGRPVGVMIQRMDNNDGAAMVLRTVEVPPPFGGLTTGETVEMSESGGTITATFSSVLPPGLIKPGDTMKVNFQGSLFEFTDATAGKDANGYFNAGTDFTVVLISGSSSLPWGGGTSAPFPYQITRQPTPSSAPPYQLPEGTVIDLFASGVGDDFFHNPDSGNNNTDPIMILFGPKGGVEYVYHNEGVPADGITTERASDLIYLLIGKPEKVNDPSLYSSVAVEELAETYNWKDLTNRWVVIAPQTGRIIGSENPFVDDDISGFSGTNQNEKVLTAIQAARGLASEMRGLGGK